MSYILHDPNVPDREFATEAEALAACPAAIEEYLDCGEWSWEVKDLHITKDGILTHRIVEVPAPIPDDIQEEMEDDTEYRPPFDYYCDYEMRRDG